MRKKMRIKWKPTKLSQKKREKDNFWDEVGEICIIKLCMKNYIIYKLFSFCASTYSWDFIKKSQGRTNL